MNKPNVLLQAGTSRVVIASTKDNIYELSVEHSFHFFCDFHIDSNVLNV